MRLLKILIVLACLFGAYRWWDGEERSRELEAIASQNGFVPVEMPMGAPAHTVLVLAPPNCPSDEAKRAEALVRALTDQGVPVKQDSAMSFEITNPTDEQEAGVERAVAVFNSGAPAVFINGMGMSNPTAAQTIAEYRKTRQGL
jgi:hypothetical protein